jgi:hypothetical protein
LIACVVIFCIVAALPPLDAAGQRRGGGPPPVPRSARDAAPIDLAGYWVAVITEDYRWRMITPPKGDVSSVPVNAEGRKVSQAWDLSADNAAGNQCKAFGVGGIVRQPGRVHITWQDENTLKMDFDAGTQTRLLRFDRTPPPAGPPTWQGNSTAEWEGPSRGRAEPQPRRPGESVDAPPVPGGGGRGLRGGPPPRNASGINQGGSLKVMTTGFREGYLRKNGVPYSENATITEYINRLPTHPNGDVWLLVTTIVDDPKYLSQPFYTSTHFKLEPDGRKFTPTPCRTDPPLDRK